MKINQNRCAYAISVALLSSMSVLSQAQATSQPVPLDSDGDGLYDSVDMDNDNDGIVNADDSAPYTAGMGEGPFLLPVADDLDCDKKVAICHFPPGNIDNTQAISISISSYDTHVDHHRDVLIPSGCDVNQNELDDATCRALAAELDVDEDGIPNYIDRDYDNDHDGIANFFDAFPLDAGEYRDVDGDGIGDNADQDDDNDGVDDINDAFPTDSAEFADTDGDGIGDNTDTDDDNDGIADVNDDFPLDAGEYRDIDGDGIGDNADPDDDNDGIADVDDQFRLNLRQQDEDLYDIFNAMVNHEGLRIGDSDLTLLDADSLFWNGLEAVEVYFINEGAGYRNQLLFTANDSPMEFIFNDVSSAESQGAWGGDALDLGDGVSLGTFDGDIQLDFLIRSDGYNNSNNPIYGANASCNADSLEHVIAYEYTDSVTDENWVVIGFEDLYGTYESGDSDRDFNDVVIAVRGIQGTQQNWTLCNIVTGQWREVTTSSELHTLLQETDVDGNNVYSWGEANQCGPGDDTDTDRDGTNDGEDAFPTDPNETTDTDGDGIGDTDTDTDFDADGDGDGLDGSQIDDSGPGATSVVSDLTICDDRIGETGTRIIITASGSVSTHDVHCD